MPPEMKQTLPICLASGSPRRAQMMTQLGLTFSTYTGNVDETQAPGEELVSFITRISEEKARSALSDFPAHLILAGDTVVVVEGEVMGKPENPDHARQMLTKLSGTTHSVFSAFTILHGVSQEVISNHQETRLTFRELPDKWIDWYANHPESGDKAGAYAIQGMGGVMLHSLQGSYSTVVGFPLETIFWIMVEKGWITL